MSRQILMMLSDRRPSTVAKISGVYRYAKNARWKVQVVDLPRAPADIPRLLALWHPDGCIVESANLGRPPSPKLLAGTRTVFLDADRRHLPRGAANVCHDSEADGRLAAKELLTIGRTSFAFIGFPGDLFWSRDREAAFLRTLRINGQRNCRRLHPASARANEIGLTREIADFVSSLPQGCGLFTANDFLANICLAVCRQLRRSVPEDLAVLGVDNNEDLCKHASPPLSSVAPDFELGGYRAAALLDRMLQNRHGVSGTTQNFGPIALVRRGSTATPAIYSGVALKITRLIRDSEGRLSPSDILRTLPCSRRTAEQQFRKSTGKTLLEAVCATRYEIACQLLRQRHLPMSEIAERIGYGSLTAFDRFFTARAGIPPLRWLARQS